MPQNYSGRRSVPLSYCDVTKTALILHSRRGQSEREKRIGEREVSPTVVAINNLDIEAPLFGSGRKVGNAGQRLSRPHR
jgi:hypothetical protein